MNIQCPKCKFSQPKDQYCAQCGIDISKYKSTISIKLKKILINSSLPLGLMLTALVVSNYQTTPSCPPLCKPANLLTIAQKNTELNSIKKQINPSKAKTIAKKVLKKSKRIPSSLKEKALKSKINTLKTIKTKQSLFKIEAQLIRFSKFSKNVATLNPNSSKLSVFPVNSDDFKNNLLENSETLSDFAEEDIKKALTGLKLLPKSKGLKLILLDNHILTTNKATKLFFENLNLNLENLQDSKGPDSFIAILINVN